jgi:hypothetical protein
VPKFRRSSTLRRALALSALALAVPAGAQAATVFDGDLETGNLSQYWLKQMCAPDRATVYSASSKAAWPKPVSGKYALRFRVLDSDVAPCTPTSNPRAQIIATNASSPGALQAGQERWEKFSVYFPSTFPKFTNHWFVFQQDYGAPWNGSPPIGFGVANDQIHIARGAQYGYSWIWSKPLQRDHWYTFVVHKKFAKNETGFIEMWLDGEQQRFSSRPYGKPASDSGVTRMYTQTMHSDATEAYQFYVNSYRSKGAAGVVESFYDGMKIGTTRADVESGPTATEPKPAPDPVAAPQAAFTASPSNAVTGSPVQFDASTSKNAVSYSWSLDGRTTLTGVKPRFTFQNAGTK